MKRSLRSWLWRVPVDQEVDEELAFHVEMRTRELVARGMDPQAARAAALRRVGDLRALKHACVDIGRKRDREMRLTQWLEEAGSDVKFAIRQLKASPGFTFVAALTLALGIGANSAMYALADATLLRPLPYRDAERLVLIEEHGPEQAGRTRIDLPNFAEWASQSRTFEAMAAIWTVPGGGGPTMTNADGTPETVPGQCVTPQAPRAWRYSGSRTCAARHSSRYLSRTYGFRSTASSAGKPRARISSSTSDRSLRRCGAVIPEASLSSTSVGNGRSAMRAPRCDAAAGSGKATGFGWPSPGYVPASTTSMSTPCSGSRSPRLPGNFSTYPRPSVAAFSAPNPSSVSRTSTSTVTR